MDEKVAPSLNNGIGEPEKWRWPHGDRWEKISGWDGRGAPGLREAKQSTPPILVRSIDYDETVRSVNAVYPIGRERACAGQ